MIFLFCPEKYEKYADHHNYAKIKIDSDNNLLLEKILELWIMLPNLLSPFLMKITASITMKRF